MQEGVWFGVWEFLWVARTHAQREIERKVIAKLNVCSLRDEKEKRRRIGKKSLETEGSFGQWGTGTLLIKNGMIFLPKSERKFFIFFWEL